MSDSNATDTTPSLFSQTLAAWTRHGLTIAAGFLAENGFISHDQQAQFISIGTSIALAAAAMGWSYVQKKQAKQAITSAVKAS